MATEDSQVGTRLLCLADPRDAIRFTEMKAVDVVAVHGLDAAGSGSWTTQDGTLWLRDLLPSDIPCARVLAFLYDAIALFTEFPTHIESVARSLLSALAMSRGNVPSTRPLVLVGHGFGGFIVEAVVNYAIAHEMVPDVKTCLKNVIFLSTPQRSSPEIPWKTLLVNSAKDSLYGLGSSAVVVIDILRCIERNAQSFQKVRAEFRKHAISLKLKILTCYEDVLTPPQQSCTVAEFCATLALKAEKVHRMTGCNHLFTARFENREDENYKAVVSAIRRVVKGPTAAPGLTVPKPEHNRASSDNSSVRLSASVRSPAELPQVSEVLVQHVSINRGDVSKRPEAIHPRSLSTSIVEATTSTQMNSSSITHVDTPPQRPSLPSSLSIQAPTRHLSLSAIGHNAIPQPNPIPDILKPRPTSLYTHTTAQGQTNLQSTSRMSTSTGATATGPEKQVSSQKFIPYRPSAADASVATLSGQRSVGGKAQTYKPFRPLSMQMPRQQDQMQGGIKDPSVLPMREPQAIPSSTFPTRPISATVPSILASGPPLDRGLSGQTLPGIAPTGPVTRDIWTAVPPPIPRSIQPANPPAPPRMRELPTGSGPSRQKIATSQLPGPLQTHGPTSMRSESAGSRHAKPEPPAPTTSRNLPSQATSGVPAVNIAVSASSAARSRNVPSPMPSASDGPTIPPKPMPYRGPPVQPATALPRGPPSSPQGQPLMPRSLGISRPPDSTTNRSPPAVSSTIQPPQPPPRQVQGPPMRSSISGHPASQLRPPGPTPISRGPPGSAPNVGPVPQNAAPPRPTLIKSAPPRPMPPRAPVPAPSATRGLQTDLKPPPKPPGILGKLFSSSTRPSPGPTRSQPPAAPAGRGMPKLAPGGGEYRPYPGPTGKQPQPKPPVPPHTREGAAYHPSPHANDTGKDMGWKHTSESSRGLHQPHTGMGSQDGHQTQRGLNSLYFSDRPIPPPQPVLHTQPQIQGPSGCLQSQTQTQTQVQGPVQPGPGEQKPEKESSSSSSTIKIAAGVAVGAAVGGLATGAIISALQEEGGSENKEPLQSGPESTGPVSGSVTGEDIPRDIPSANQGGGDIDPEDPSQWERVAEVETETGSTSGDNSVSTPGSTSDSDSEGGNGEDEGDYTGGYDGDGDGYEYYHDLEHAQNDNEHNDGYDEHGDASYDPDYDDAQHDQYNNDEDGDYDEYGNTEQGGDDGQDESEYENEVEPTYQQGEQYQDDYQDEGDDEDEHYTYEGEDQDQEDEGHPGYQYQGEYENSENGGDDEEEEEGQTDDSENEYQGEESEYEHQGQYNHDEGDEDEDDESENEEQTGHYEGASEYQETEYVDHEYDHNANDDDEDEDEYQTDYQQYEPEYQVEYQAPEVEYEPEPDYQVSYEPEYQPEYQEQYQADYEPEYQAAYEPEFQVEYQQEYQPEYEPEYGEQTDYGDYGDYDQGYDYDDGYY